MTNVKNVNLANLEKILKVLKEEGKYDVKMSNRKGCDIEVDIKVDGEYFSLLTADEDGGNLCLEGGFYEIPINNFEFGDFEVVVKKFCEITKLEVETLIDGFNESEEESEERKKTTKKLQDETIEIINKYNK